MKRWICRIMVCLLLGVVTTVGVAWGLAYWGTWSFDAATLQRGPSGTVPYPGRLKQTRLSIISSRGFGQVAIQAGDALFTDGQQYDIVPNEDLFPGWCRAVAVRNASSRVGWNFNRDYYTARGFPLVALWTHIRKKGNADGIPSVHGGIALTDSGRFDPLTNGPVLPYRVVLPGFLINTLFYAVIWFVPLFGISATRRTVRRKRGRCVKCGYDLRGTPGGSAAGCSECGWRRE